MKFWIKTDMRYRIKSWAEFQHYKDRCPPWIKLHHSILTSKVWIMSDDASRALIVASMLLAARNKENDGSFDGDPEFVKRFAYLNSEPNFKLLIQYDFIERIEELEQNASIVLARCNTETETETEKDLKQPPIPPLVASLPDWIPRPAWDEFLAIRKSLKVKNTDHAINLLIGKLADLRTQGHDPKAVLNQSIMHSWKGLFPIQRPPSGQHLTAQQKRQAMNELSTKEFLDDQSNTIEFGRTIDHAG